MFQFEFYDVYCGESSFCLVIKLDIDGKVMHFGHHYNWSLMLSVTGTYATELLWIFLFSQSLLVWLDLPSKLLP